MKRSIITLCAKALFLKILVFGFAINVFAQKVPKAYYASVSGGVKLYESPKEQAKNLAVIPYGSKVTFSNSDADKLDMGGSSLIVNGGRTYWMKVAYNNVKGYVIKDDLATVKPPKAHTNKLSDWVKQVSQPSGNKWQTGKISVSLSESENDNYLSRQVFRNGMLLTEVSGYEYFSETLQIPFTNAFSVYNLMKNIENFKSIFKLNTELREGKYSFKDSHGNEYRWEVYYETGDDVKDKILKSVEISWNDASNNTLKIYALGEDIAVFYESWL